MLSFLFPFLLMHWDWDIHYWTSSLAKLHGVLMGKSTVIFISFYISRISPYWRAEKDLVETALIESLLHQLYLHCERERGKGEVRASSELRVCRILYLSETDCLSLELWRAGELPGSPRQCPGMPVWLLSDRWMGLFLAAGPGNAVIIWKCNSFTCCTHTQARPAGSMLNGWINWDETINVNP